MLTSQGILRNHYSLVFPAQLMSDRTKYKGKPSGKFKEKKRKQSHDSQSGPKTRKGNDKEGIQTKCPLLLQRKTSERSVCETGHKATVKRTPVAQVRVTSKRSPPAGEGGVHLEKLGGSVRPASQNPYPIYDQNLPYL